MTATNTASPLGLADWHQQLADVARRAGELPTNASLDDRASLAQDAFQLLWLAWSPALIAQSCRLSARLNEPLMADPGPLDEQVLSVHDVRSQCLRSVDQLAIKKLLPLPKRFSIQGRPHQTKAAAAEVVEEVAAEVPARPVEARIAEARAAAVRVKPPLRPIAERLAAKERQREAAAEAATARPRDEAGRLQVSADLREAGRPLELDQENAGPENSRSRSGQSTQHPQPPAPLAQHGEIGNGRADESRVADGHSKPAGWGDPEQVLEELEPMPPAPVEPVPADWLKAGEVAELLNRTREWLHCLRKKGETGAQGIDWRQTGPKSFYFSPQIVEKLEQLHSGPELDHLLAELRE
jgi:hypothetical protein